MKFISGETVKKTVFEFILANKTLTKRGLEFKAAIQCSGVLNLFRKSPDAYGI